MTIQFKKRKSRLAQKISIWFEKNRNESMNLGEILDKYCEKGMSRRYVANLLMDMKGKNGLTLKTEITIKETPLWEAWKSEVEKGRCSFEFKSKFPGNQYHGNKGIKRILKNQKIEKLVIDLECLKCGYKNIESKNVGKEPRYLIALKAHQCPRCKNFSTTQGSFEIKGVKYTKRVVENKEIFIERI